MPKRLMKVAMLSAREFADIRARMAKLTPGDLIMVTEKNMTPAQMNELERSTNFVVVAARENSGNGHFYCIGLRSDTQLALDTVKALVTKIGGKNIQQMQAQ